MNIIKNYIRNKLAELIIWAIGAQLDKMKYAIGQNTNRFDTIQREQHKQARAIGMLANVAVDHHIQEGASWAVVCTRKPSGRERVNFYRIQDNRVDELDRVLYYFKRDNVIVDCHPSVKQYFI